MAPLEHSIHGQRANPPGSKDFVTPNGSASIVSHFFKKSDTTVDFEHHVTAIKSLSNRWKVEANVRINFEYRVLVYSVKRKYIYYASLVFQGERCEEFDVVILTMPGT